MKQLGITQKQKMDNEQLYLETKKICSSLNDDLQFLIQRELSRDTSYYSKGIIIYVIFTTVKTNIKGTENTVATQSKDAFHDVISTTFLVQQTTYKFKTRQL